MHLPVQAHLPEGPLPECLPADLLPDSWALVVLLPECLPADLLPDSWAQAVLPLECLLVVLLWDLLPELLR